MRRTPIRSVSNRRARANRQRRELAQRFHEAPACVWPAGCGREAVDLHELLSRGRGGSITDVDNIVPLCRPHHDFVTTNPAEAERLGMALPGRPPRM